MNPLIQFKTTTLPFFIALVCFACLPSTQAVTPAPDGGYPGYNTAEGLNALASATPGVWNTAIGAYALSSSAPGGIGNTAVGLNSLRHNSTGTFNSALGVNSLLFNSSGSQNVGIGYQALDFNTTATHNTGVGFQALFTNNANDNTAIGWRALFHNTTAGVSNTATGSQALIRNTNGGFNVANGFQALNSNTIGIGNTAIGNQALANNTAGSGNIALGNSAGFGLSVGVSNNNIDIGNAGVAGDSQTIRIGVGQTRAFIAGIYLETAASGIPVFINSAGQLGTNSSSARFKQNIQDMGESSDAVLALRPVTFRYKQQLDPDGIPQFGLVAEEVEKVNPDLVTRDAKGEVYTVRYEAVNAMLLNEFLKEHRKVEELNSTAAKQEATITQLKSAVAKQEATAAQQQKEIATLTAGLQKVSDQLELSKPAPRTVLNNQ